MKARLAIAIVLGAALLTVPAALGSNAQTFADSIGEDAQAPDITSVAVSNDDAANITFKVNISNRPALTPDMLLLVYLDTDQNPATGSANLNGIDYVIQLEPGAVSLFQWNGSDFVFAQTQSTLTYAYDATGATFHINGQDLGDTKGFNFAAEADSGLVVDSQGNVDDTNAHFDLAPDAGHGFFTYKMIVKVTLTKTAFTTTPAKAGKRLSASLAANESDTAAAVRTGTVTCKGVAGTARLRATHSLRHGVATCNWNLPKTAKGKLFHGTVTISSQGATLTKTFTARVR